ncbi:MAG: HD domain-containing protein [Candidatus Shapirobacteria bacterium]
MLTVDQIYKLHQKYCHGNYYSELFDLCWTHSQIVKEIALQISATLSKNNSIKADNDLIVVGALVHDIGIYSCFDDNFKKVGAYVTHGNLGYEILKKEGVEEKVARFSLCHTTTGLTKENVTNQNIPLVAKDYIPITLEEEIISYADSFHSKGHPQFNYFEQVKLDYERFGDNVVFMFDRFSRKFGIPDLTDLELKYKDWHEQINRTIIEIKAKQVAVSNP